MNDSPLNLFNQGWRIVDHTTYGPAFRAIQSFAYDDTLCTSVGKGASPPTLRAWVHRPTIVLGIQDSRLPNIDAGVAALKEQDYDVIVRNSGGLAVVLDEGVLNLSFIVQEEKGFSIDDGYELMYSFIKRMFPSYAGQIEAKEIVGSYCPGSYDLSISGKKFAGISQRRIRHGVAVQIYLCVTGSGSQRAETIRDFYHIAVNDQPTKFAYPRIRPETMASLADLLNVPLSMSEIVTKAYTTLKEGGATLTQEPFSTEEISLYEHHLLRMKERNLKLLQKHGD